MHCLYCDRPLALLKRLTGDGEFCSKEHRKIYQREHSQLALARLLEASGGGAKARPGKTAPPKREPEPPSVVEPAPAEPRQEPAGFFSYSLEAVAASDRLLSTGVPRFKSGTPVGSEAASLGAARPGPRVAVHFTQFPPPRAVDGVIRRQERSSLGFSPGHLQLAERPFPALATSARRQPTGAGFLIPQPLGATLPGKARRPAGPHFRPLAQSRGAKVGMALGNAVDPGIRPAKFVSNLPTGSAVASQTRAPGVAPRWKLLEPVLPQSEPGKITLVLGSFLRRPVRTASQDRIPDTFEIPFQPVSFPAYSPRMGCLEERLHRTDRIGFSPP
jgi:hypothetical protein